MAIKNILKYLRRTKGLFLIYGDSDFIVSGYTDANFQSDGDDFKSHSRYVYTLNGGLVNCKSSKQDTTTDSTIELEYIVASESV